MSDSIQPIIVMVDRQKESVTRLVEYCHKLDGTKVGVVRLPADVDSNFIPEFPNNQKESRASFSLNWAARAMNGKPFIWMEHDSIPLKPGWCQCLIDEYVRLGRPYMLSSDSNPPHDLIGGIGVYSGVTEWLIPIHYERYAWDMWMVNNIGRMISRTPLIQHSYGVYDSKGNADPHRFPRDAFMLRNDALIFHRDVHHDLIDPSNHDPKKVTFYHSGDLGDIVYHAEVIRRRGGGDLNLGQDMGFEFHQVPREPLTRIRYESIAPLLACQKYIGNVRFVDGFKYGWVNLNIFRKHLRHDELGHFTLPGTSLQSSALRTFGVQSSDESTPWLTVDEAFNGSKGKIVFARSERYPDPSFPWKRIVQRFGKNAVFVGVPKEHQIFCQSFGNVEYAPTKDLLDVARVISSARMFVGNQSCPYAIAEGLKKPAVQESWPTEPNCLFNRPNVLQRSNDFDQIARFIDSIP